MPESNPVPQPAMPASCHRCYQMIDKRDATCKYCGAKDPGLERPNFGTGKEQPNHKVIGQAVAGTLCAFLFMGTLFFTGVMDKIGLSPGSLPSFDMLNISDTFRHDFTPVANRETGPQLELISWNWSISSEYADIEGQVKNITSEPINNIMGVASLFTADGTFVKTAEALIEYLPLMPGQTSPFRLLTPYNPQIKKAGLEFKHMFGGVIATKRRSKASDSNSAEWIVWVQGQLAYRGYDVGTLDGKMGPKTRAAIRAYQRDKKVKVTGEITEHMFD